MIERAKELFARVMGNKQLVLILIVTLAFIGATVYVYKSYIAPKLQAKYAPNKEYIKASDGPSGRLRKGEGSGGQVQGEWLPYN